MTAPDLRERLIAERGYWPRTSTLDGLLLEAAEAVAERDHLQESLNRLTGMKFSDRVHAALVARVINAEVALNELYTAARQVDIECNLHGEPSTPELAQFEEALKRTGQYFRDPGNQEEPANET